MNEPPWSPEVARAMHEFANAAPIPPPASRVGERRTPTRRRPIAASLIAAAIALAGIVGTIAFVTRDSGTKVGTTDFTVRHEQYAVSLTAQLECDTPIDSAGAFDTMTIDTWSDRAGRQWRSQVTYPDGTTHDTIVRGSIIYPVEQFERGDRRDRSMGCVGPDAEPFTLAAADSSFFTLTLTPELAPDELPYVRLYNQVGALVDVNGTDSRGRAAREWELRTAGSAGYGNNANLPLQQVTRWFVDPTDGTTVNERTFTNTVETMGTATLTETLVVAEDIAATSELFSTAGHRALGGTRRPDPPSTGPEMSAPASQTTVATTPSSSDGDCAGADLDVAHEPPLWRQPNNATWFRTGCVVRIDVITDRPGPDHCGWGTARVIIVGQPLGSRFTTDPIQYVRDPANAFGSGLDAGYDGNATLPERAVDTGYRTDTEQLWIVPGDDRFIYLVAGRSDRALAQGSDSAVQLMTGFRRSDGTPTPPSRRGRSSDDAWCVR